MTPRRAWPAAALALAACAPPPFVAGPVEFLPEPDPADAAGVVFLVGDAGSATVDGAPLLHRLRADVERWSAALGPDSAVAVLFLGDVVYPAGVRDPDHGDFARDTARLHAQVWTVDGPSARARGARGIFVAGNHDWGNLQGAAGLARLRNLEDELRRLAGGGRAVALRPSAGAPGPDVVTVGPARLIALDTEWWIQPQDPAARGAALERLAAAMADADGRPVVMAAHHPLASAGVHGGGGGLDPFWLLRKAGAVVQDLNSEPYRRLVAELRGAFARIGPPLVYAAGHDHALQVLRGSAPDLPPWMLVSGAGSERTRVSRAAELVWAGDGLGYMRLTFGAGGRVDLHVVGAPAGTPACPPDGAEPGCAAWGAAAFRTVYAARLR